MKKYLLPLAVAAATMIGSSAMAASILSGTFKIDIYSTDAGGSRAKASATEANINNFAGPTDTITYTGALNFGTFDGKDRTTIGSWLATGGGSISGLSAATAGLQLSAPTFARTTFFDIRSFFSTGFDSVVRHDDGMTFFQNDGSVLKASSAPTTAKNTTVNGFNGGDFRLIYVATNGDPSVLKVTGDDLPVGGQVPLPAGLPLLLSGLVGMGLIARRRRG